MRLVESKYELALERIHEVQEIALDVLAVRFQVLFLVRPRVQPTLDICGSPGDRVDLSVFVIINEVISELPLVLILLRETMNNDDDMFAFALDGTNTVQSANATVFQTLDEAHHLCVLLLYQHWLQLQEVEAVILVPLLHVVLLEYREEVADGLGFAEAEELLDHRTEVF